MFTCPIHGDYVPANTGTTVALCPQCSTQPHNRELIENEVRIQRERAENAEARVRALEDRCAKADEALQRESARANGLEEAMREIGEKVGEARQAALVTLATEHGGDDLTIQATSISYGGLRGD